jgi:hypothetical protein
MKGGRAVLLPIWWWKWFKERKENDEPSPKDGTASVFRWLHREREFPKIAAEALDTAKREAWGELDEKTRRRQFRAFVLLTLQIAPLSAAPGTLGQLGAHLYSTPDRNAAGSAIARTFAVLAPPGLRDVMTDEAEPGMPWSDTGMPILLAVALACAGALAAAFIANTIGNAAHAINFDDETTKRLLSTQARALEIISLHVERERIAGRELPFDEAERAWLLGLEDMQRQIVTMQRQPLPKPFEGATEFVRTAAFSALPIAVVVLLAFFFLNHSEQGRS